LPMAAMMAVATWDLADAAATRIAGGDLFESVGLEPGGSLAGPAGRPS